MQPAWVFSSRQLPLIEGADVRFVSGDVRPVLANMRAAAGDKNIWIVGGGDLAGQFHDAGLLDEVIVQIGSATLGRGKPLLPRRLLSPVLQLQSVQQMGPGMAELRYTVCKTQLPELTAVWQARAPRQSPPSDRRQSSPANARPRPATGAHKNASTGIIITLSVEATGGRLRTDRTTRPGQSPAPGCH
jgi:hypothetical protein